MLHAFTLNFVVVIFSVAAILALQFYKVMVTMVTGLLLQNT